MSKAKLITAAVVALILVTVAIGPDRFWRLAGDPDLGPVSFTTLMRRTTPNDALACPPGLCSARSDLQPPVYGIPARELEAAFATMITAEPRVVRVAVDDASMTERYVQRTRWLGFPDTIVVRFIDQPDGRSTVAVYSRSQIGLGDLGVNRRRIVRWLTDLSAAVQSR